MNGQAICSGILSSGCSAYHVAVSLNRLRIFLRTPGITPPNVPPFSTTRSSTAVPVPHGDHCNWTNPSAHAARRRDATQRRSLRPIPSRKSARRRRRRASSLTRARVFCNENSNTMRVSILTRGAQPRRPLAHPAESKSVAGDARDPRLLQHWLSDTFSGVRRFFCQILRREPRSC